MGLIRMDNVGIVVEDLDAAIEFFTELGERVPEAMRRQLDVLRSRLSAASA